MYDWPEIHDLFDRLWASVAGRLHDAGYDAPERLTRSLTADALWQARDLCLGQTCGWPLVYGAARDARVVARSHHDLTKCPPGKYVSVLIGREERKAFGPDCRPAVNEPGSFSGAIALTRHASAHGIVLGAPVFTGSHRASIATVRDGDADIAAIDAISWSLAAAFDDLGDLVVMGQTAPAPSLPFITSPDMPSDRDGHLVAALRGAFTDPANNRLRKLLRVVNILPSTRADYRSLTEMDQPNFARP